MLVLVVRGAGYIGSHMVKRRGANGINVTTLDNLSSGRRKSVLCGDFVEGDLGDFDLLSILFLRKKFDAVMHFAAHIEVGVSVASPAKYYSNNVASTKVLLDAMLAYCINKFILSSTGPGK